MYYIFTQKEFSIWSKQTICWIWNYICALIVRTVIDIGSYGIRVCVCILTYLQTLIVDKRTRKKSFGSYINRKQSWMLITKKLGSLIHFLLMFFVDNHENNTSTLKVNWRKIKTLLFRFLSSKHIIILYKLSGYINVLRFIQADPIILCSWFCHNHLL
jgi:hypothetical protein